jgi:hypothetical protein
MANQATAYTMLNIAMSILRVDNSRRHDHTFRPKAYTKFRAVFGTTPHIAASAWTMLMHNNAVPRRTRQRHLLYTLAFLKTYASSEVLGALLSADRGTVMRWVWIVLHGLHSCKHLKVSWKH